MEELVDSGAALISTIERGRGIEGSERSWLGIDPYNRGSIRGPRDDNPNYGYRSLTKMTLLPSRSNGHPVMEMNPDTNDNRPNRHCTDSASHCCSR